MPIFDGDVISGPTYWHKQAWSKKLIKPRAWRSYVFDEDWWRSTWRLCF